MIDPSSPFESFSSLSYQFVEESPGSGDEEFLEESRENTSANGWPTAATRNWFMVEMKKGLINHLTYLVSIRLPREDPEEIRGEVGLCIAQWCDKDSFRKFFDSGKYPSRKLLSDYVWRSVTTGMMHRGIDAQLRDRTGAKTQAEVRAGKPAPVSQKLAPNTWKAVTITDESTQERSTEIVDKGLNPEQASIESSNHDACLETAKNILRLRRPRGAVRRVQVLEAAIRGAAKGELEEQLGVSSLRATFLRQEVRDDLREGLKMLETARKVLHMVLDEPYITQTEIVEDLGFTTKEEVKEVKRITQILIRRKLITSKNGSFLGTSAAHNEIF